MSRECLKILNFRAFFISFIMSLTNRSEVDFHHRTRSCPSYKEKGETQHKLHLPGCSRALTVSFFFWCLFLRAPCRRRLDRDNIRIPFSISNETGHLQYPFFLEIVQDIALVGMGAGEACPCVAQSTESAAVLAFGAFDSIFSVFHYAVSFLFPDFFRFSMWHLTKMWKLSSR